MSKILVTGGNGQLASCIKDVARNFSNDRIIFKNSEELDITSKARIDAFFEREQLHFCINCAGYTAVDEAESNPKKAKNSNTIGASNLAEACAEFGVKLIHISTDFVFDGYSNVPYTEDDSTNPLGIYGQSKLDGELAIKKVLKEHFIIRTSWLYSEYGHNFVKTMLRLGSEKKKLAIVADQVGSPTYGGDLANAILEIATKNTDKYGTYHYCNTGSASWFDFAKKIFELRGLKNGLIPVTTLEYPTAARRPSYSVLNTNKIKNTFQLIMPRWQDSLEKCFEKLDMGRDTPS